MSSQGGAIYEHGKVHLPLPIFIGIVIVTVVLLILTIVGFSKNSSNFVVERFIPGAHSSLVLSERSDIGVGTNRRPRDGFLNTRTNGPVFWDSNAELQTYYSQMGTVDPSQDGGVGEPSAVIVPASKVTVTTDSFKNRREHANPHTVTYSPGVVKVQPVESANMVGPLTEDRLKASMLGA